MSRRMETSSSRCVEEEFGKETGLPLIVCPKCKRLRVIELIVRTTENGNQGRVFFKCPRNVPDMPGRCRFFEFHKTYLMKLVELKYVVIDLEAGLDRQEAEEAGAWGFGHGEEAQSVLAPAPDDGMKPNTICIEMKLDALLSLLKMLIVAFFFCSVLGIMYAVFK